MTSQSTQTPTPPVHICRQPSLMAILLDTPYSTAFTILAVVLWSSVSKGDTDIVAGLISLLLGLFISGYQRQRRVSVRDMAFDPCAASGPPARRSLCFSP